MTKRFEIERPSARADATMHSRLSGEEPERLSIRISQLEWRAIFEAAHREHKTMKDFVLDACRAAGAELPDREE